MLNTFLNPKNDSAFKRIFGSEKNKDILIHFLNDMLGRNTNPVEEITFLPTVQDPETVALRSSRVDVICKDTIVVASTCKLWRQEKSINETFIRRSQVIHYQ